jgi:hypothetical protein
MKIVGVEVLQNCGKYAASEAWHTTRAMLHEAVQRVSWPPGGKSFTIYPESGKKRGKGYGVKPIKNELMQELQLKGWKLEEPLNLAAIKRPGKLDAVLYTSYGPVALEWETGNISSSHRALNKMALGLLKGVLACGILVVPSRNLYKYLTDRVANFAELSPYLDLWRSIRCEEAVFELVVVEHDAESEDVPKIPKGTDGRALL